MKAHLVSDIDLAAFLGLKANAHCPPAPHQRKKNQPKQLIMVSALGDK